MQSHNVQKLLHSLSLGLVIQESLKIEDIIFADVAAKPSGRKDARQNGIVFSTQALQREKARMWRY